MPLVPLYLIDPDAFEKDPELRAKYYHAHLLKQFGNIPAVHIVAAREREKILTDIYQMYQGVSNHQ